MAEVDRWRRVQEWLAADRDRGRYTKAMVAAGLVSAVVFALVMGTLSDQRLQANYYDVQARAILDGRLDVPQAVLGQEPIIHDGKAYLYWPPGPAVMRLPILVVTDELDGRLTPLSMTVAWSLFVVVLGLLIWRLRRQLRGSAPLTDLELACLAGFLVSVMAGSLLVYLVAVPWVYHESILWGLACALGAAHALLGYVERPSRRGAWAVGLFALGALMTRGPAGYASLLAAVLVGIWLAVGGRGEEHRRAWPPLALAVLVPMATSVAVNWAKFETLNSYPMADQVHSAASEHRQQALEANGGDLFGIDLVPSTLWNYLRPDGIRFTGQYPFIDAPAELPTVVGDAFFDTLNRTPSIVSFSPLLVLLAVWGAVRVVAARRGTRLTWVRFPLLGAAAVPAAALWISGITPRFAAEFVPVLAVAGAVGALDVARRLVARPRADRRLLLGGLALVAAFGVAANVAYGLTTRATAGAGHDLADHVSRQLWFAERFGGELDEVVASVSLPREAPPGEIRVVDDCRAVYYSTGEHGHTTKPWLQVTARPVAFRLARSTAPGAAVEGSVPVARFDGLHRIVLSLERTANEYRFVLEGGGADSQGTPFELTPGRPVDVLVDTDPPYSHRVEVDGEVVLEVPKEDNDSLYQAMPNVLSPLTPTEVQTSGLGVIVEDASPPPDPLCERLLEHARGDAG